MKPKTTSTGVMADQYLALMTEQAELAKKVKALKDAMLATGKVEFDGAYARVTISVQTGRTGTDMKAVDAHYAAIGVPVPTKKLADSIRFNVNARLADSSVAA